jgi:hypothetical protein
MFAPNFPYIANALVFILYFVFTTSHPAWGKPFLWWAWAPYIIHLLCHHFADGLQNTTRNIARIYLIKNRGVQYPTHLLTIIQNVLIPNSILPFTIVWIISHIGSFSVLLFFQGWGVALIAEFIVLFFSVFIPINYQKHLKLIHRRSQNLDIANKLYLYDMDIHINDIASLINEAIEGQKNPQSWWSEVLIEAENTLEK